MITITERNPVVQQCCGPLCCVVSCRVVDLLTSVCSCCRSGGGRVGSEEEPQRRVSQMVGRPSECVGSVVVVLRFCDEWCCLCHRCRFALLTVMTSEYESMHQKLKSSHVLKVTAPPHFPSCPCDGHMMHQEI